MATREEVDLIVNAIAQGFDSVKSEMDGLTKAQDRQDESNKRSRMGFADLKAGLDIVKEAYSGVSQVVAFTANAINEGAQLQLARSQFDNLTASIGATSDAMLNDLRAATNGMMSDADLIAGASDIISLGLADTQEDTVRLATAVGTLGLDMQQVILTFANNSKARLDSLGLSIQDVDRITEEFIATGMDADKAFDQAVLVALEDKMALLGDTSETTAGKIMKLTAAQENLTNRFNEFMALQWEPILGGMVNTMDSLEASTNKGRGTMLNAAIVLKSIATEGSIAEQALSKYVETQEAGLAPLWEINDATAEYDRQLTNVANAMNGLESSAVAVTEAEREQMMAASEAAFADSELADKVQQLGNHMSESEALIYNANAALRDQGAAANETHGPMSEGISLTDRINAEIERLNAQPKDFKFNMNVSGLEKLREAVRLAGQMGGAHSDMPDPYGEGDAGPSQNEQDDAYDRGDAEYAMGGWTGNAGGVVHPNELVIPSSVLNQGAGAMMSFAQQHVPGGVSGGSGVQINGPLIGSVSMRPGENVNAFASRVSTMVTQKLGELN